MLTATEEMLLAVRQIVDEAKYARDGAYAKWQSAIARVEGAETAYYALEAHLKKQTKEK